MFGAYFVEDFNSNKYSVKLIQRAVIKMESTLLKIDILSLPIITLIIINDNKRKVNGYWMAVAQHLHYLSLSVHSTFHLFFIFQIFFRQ